MPDRRVVVWMRIKPAAVHCEDDHGGRIEDHQPRECGCDTHSVCRIRNRQIQCNSKDEERRIGSSSTKKVRYAGSEKLAQHIEDADYQYRGAAKLASIVSCRVVPKISVIMVLATPRTPMPAVTLKHNTTQSR